MDIQNDEFHYSIFTYVHWKASLGSFHSFPYLLPIPFLKGAREEEGAREGRWVESYQNMIAQSVGFWPAENIEPKEQTSAAKPLPSSCPPVLHPFLSQIQS